jgi:hypothetical protein
VYKDCPATLIASAVFSQQDLKKDVVTPEVRALGTATFDLV